jgi:hypothetical protein
MKTGAKLRAIEIIVHQDTLLLDRNALVMNWATMVLWAVTIVLAGDAEALD